MEAYELAIVTFLDILGFRDLVDKAEAQEVNAKLEAVERFTRPILTPPTEDPEETYEPFIRQFSDTFVRIRRVRTKLNQRQPIGLVFHELLDLVHAQGELIREGVLLRGGISFGRIYASEDRLFGPALVAAYELESKFALYPRIVIDPFLLTEFRKNDLLKAAYHDMEEEEQYIRNLIHRGDDGIWFIDYIRAVATELDENDMYPIFLQSHRQLILDGTNRFAGLSHPMSKYLWLASYHNECVSQLKPGWFEHYELKRQHLLINSDDMEALQEIPSKHPGH